MSPRETPVPSSAASSTSEDPSAASNPPRDSPTIPRERKGGLACAECRRSKLKCDRVVPCSACVRRGCAPLCPNGVMNATKGNKALQSHAQKLGEQVTSMSAKIKELESALAAAHLQLRSSSEPPEETRDRNLDWNYSVRRRSYTDSSGSLAIDQDGVSRYYGDTASSEYFTGLLPGAGLSSIYHLPDLRQLNLPTEIIELCNAFPFGLRERPHNKSSFLTFIPTRDHALQLAENYYQGFAWMCNPVTRCDFQSDILDRIYSYGDIPHLDSIHPHRLAVFFGILSLGALRNEAADKMQAERFHALSCAALSLAPVISEAMCATIQTLFLCNGFLFTAVRVASEECWLLIGLAGRLSYRIGLHRDGTHFNLPRDEVQRRRVIFWELYTWDAWLSFVTGRAPSIHLSHTDTKFPDEENDSGIMGYHAWKYRYTAGCLWPTVRTSLAEVVSYQTIINLDYKIRTFPIPMELQAPLQGYQGRTWSNDPASAMQQFCFICERELNLLYLHRNYFAEALRAAQDNPLAHKFGGSVMATYRSAVRMCVTLRDLCKVHAARAGRVWYFWSGVFSSCIVLAAISITSPGCSMAQNSLAELRMAVKLFDEGSKPCRHPKALYILQNLSRRAEESYSSYWDSPDGHTIMSALRSVTGELDELCILGGLENVIPHRTLSASPSQTTQRLSDVRTQTGLPPDATSLPSQKSTLYPPSSDSQLSHPTSQGFEFSGLDNIGVSPFNDQGMPSSALPTYEEIMSSRYASQFSPSAPATPLRYAPGGSSAAGFSEDFGQFPQGHGGSEPLGSEGPGIHESVWRSFIGGLMSGPVDGFPSPF